jgi:hypothetical protein
MEPIALPIADAQRLSGLSRTMLYHYAEMGWISLFRPGKQTLVLTEDLRTLMRRLRDARPAALGAQPTSPAGIQRRRQILDAAHGSPTGKDRHGDMVKGSDDLSMVASSVERSVRPRS